MNKETNSIDTLINKFSIEKYSNMDELNISKWCHLLHKRSEYLHFDYPNGFQNENIFFSKLLDDPLDKETLNNKNFMRSIPKLGIVKDLRNLEIICSSNTIKNKVKGGKEAYDNWDKQLEVKNRILDDSFHDTLMDQNLYAGMYHQVFIEIDLSATDEDIEIAFSKWLKSKREQIEKYSISPREKKFTTKDFNLWANKKVLPYIDLMMLEKYYGAKLTFPLIGKLLFPNEHYIDVGERVRKVVKPLSDGLLEFSSLDAISLAADNYEREKAE